MAIRRIAYFPFAGGVVVVFDGWVVDTSGGETLRAVPAVALSLGVETDTDADPAGRRSGFEPAMAPPSGLLTEIDACGETADEPSELHPAKSKGIETIASVRRIMMSPVTSLSNACGESVNAQSAAFTMRA